MNNVIEGFKAGEFDTSWLDKAELGERVKSDIDDYPQSYEMTEHILRFNSEAPVKIEIEDLAQNGIVIDDTMEEYLANESASSSALKQVLKTPANYYFYMHDKNNFKPKKKDCFELGTFCHMAFLEPELFDKVKVEPKHNRATKDGVINLIEFYEKVNNVTGVDVATFKMDELKSYLETLMAQCKFTMISEDDKLKIDIIKRNYFRYGNGIIPMLLKGAINEVSFYAEDLITGRNVKVRPDALNIAENIGVDAVISFKTTSAETIGKFTYDAAKYQYELSEGMYQEVISQVTGRKFNSTIMIMLQTVAPYQPAVFWWSAEDLITGKYKYRYALDMVHESEAKGLWPGFESLAEQGNYGIIEMQLHDWSKKLIHPVDIDN